jgi:Matrixin
VTVASSGPDVAGIVDELVAITGLHLTMVSGPADITVAFGSIAANEDMGLTSWRAVNGWLTQATIVISAQAQPFLATVLRHELAHALGLRHAAGADEVMYPGAGPNSPTDYQAGDLAGLRLVGASAGC